MITSKDCEMIGEWVGKAIAPLQEKIAELQTRPALLWKGTWRSGESYGLHDLVQDKSTIWVAVAPKAEGRPGADAGWRMLVKTQERAAK